MLLFSHWKVVFEWAQQQTNSSQTQFLLCFAYYVVIHSTGARSKIFVPGMVENSGLAAFCGKCSDCGCATLERARQKESVLFSSSYLNAVLSVGLVWVCSDRTKRDSKLTLLSWGIYCAERSCSRGGGNFPLPLLVSRDTHFAVCLHNVHSFRDDSHAAVAGSDWEDVAVQRVSWMKVWVLPRAPGCLQWQHARSCLPALKAKDVPWTSCSRFLQWSGCCAALFIPGVWHCLLVELIHLEKGEPAVLLEKGSHLTNGLPFSQCWKGLFSPRSGAEEIIVPLWEATCSRTLQLLVEITSITTWS